MRKRWGWREETSDDTPARTTDPERVAALIEEDWDSDFLKIETPGLGSPHPQGVAGRSGIVLEVRRQDEGRLRHHLTGPG